MEAFRGVFVPASAVADAISGPLLTTFEAASHKKKVKTIRKKNKDKNTKKRKKENRKRLVGDLKIVGCCQCPNA